MTIPAAEPGVHRISVGTIRSELARRLRAVVRSARRAHQNANAEEVHRLRVATRRAGAALRVFGPILDTDERDRVAADLKSLRGAASALRDADVHAAMFRELGASATPELAPAVSRAIEMTEAERLRAESRLGRATRKSRRRRLAASGHRLLTKLDDRSAPAARDLGSKALDMLAGAARVAAAEDLTDIAALHRLRIAMKRLRYATELMDDGLKFPVQAGLREHLSVLQERLGDVNDADSMAARLERYAAQDATLSGPMCVAEVSAGGSLTVGDLARRYRRLCAQRHASFVNWWTNQGYEATFGLLARPNENHTSVRTPQELLPATPPANGELFPSRRFGAIDVGSNSIRLLLAEVLTDGRLRIIDDEKETTRLAQGLHETGALSADAMARSAEVIWRMLGIARGYGVPWPRAIATSAVRDAKNSADFLELVERITGIRIEVISAEQEARLAFHSAAASFDLEAERSAVVDVGGGSAQIVLSEQGIIEQMHTLRLGAVRLTERFGGPRAASGRNLRSLRAFVDATLKDEVGRLPLRPATLIGTGGTMSALGAMALALRHGPGSGEAAMTRIQGTEVSRSTVRELIERLADLPLPARARFPGLPSDRADIIVPGLVVVHRIMKHLGLKNVVIHQGGIRAGLLRQMADDAFGTHRAGAVPRDPLVAIRTFARTLSYELDHSEHVAALALQLFDQLAAKRPDAPWADGAARLLLESAGILHDIGYAIGYEDHHKHSYQIITHSDLPGLTSRQIELIAVISRYHRRAEPSRDHACFSRLSPADRKLVRRLAAILRVADGLDRTHSQNVRGIQVVESEGRMDLSLQAHQDPITDIWGAERKSGLFERVFGVEVAFTWTTEPVNPDTRANASAGPVPAPKDHEAPPRPALRPSPMLAPSYESPNPA